MTNIINPAKFGRIDPKDWRDYPDIYTKAIWPANLPSKPADYGNNSFHGRTHPDIIKVAVNRYTIPGDVVWDCFGGSGTTLDVCKELFTNCIINDVNPTRPDIIKQDSRFWHPDKLVDLVICHPPYMNIVDYGDGYLSTDNLSQWLDGMQQVLDNVHACLKQHRMLVVIVGTVYNKQHQVCLDYELMRLLSNTYRLTGRVIRDFGETKGGATTTKRDEHLWVYRRLKGGLWELGQDVVLFLQKL